MAASTGQQLRTESGSRTDEGMSSGVEMGRDEEVSVLLKGMIRDEELSDAFVEEELERWERFLMLSWKEALASTKGMQEVFDIVNSVPDDDDSDDGVSDRFTLRGEELLGGLADIEDGTALLLAVVGRRLAAGRTWSQCTKVHVNPNYGCRLEAREAIALCANLKSNTDIKLLDVDGQKIFGTPQMCAVLSEALTTSNTLTFLNMDGVGMTPVALRCLLFGGRSRSSWHPTKPETDLAVQVGNSSDDYGEISKLRNEIKVELEKLEGRGLLANVSLDTLIISRNTLSDTTSLAMFLSKNPPLTCLLVYHSSLDFLSARGMAEALKWNSNLEILNLTRNEMGYDGVELIFESLSQNIREAATRLSPPRNNTTLKRLEIGRMKESFPACVPVESLLLMLETNTSLTSLRIGQMSFEPEHWTQQILPALSKNKTLEKLDLESCGGLTGDEVREALFKVVQENNTGLRSIDLSLTGMSDWQGQVDEELRINAEYRATLRDQSMVTPTSGRLVLCGYEFGGKTTIRKTMERICHPDMPREDPFQRAWKTFMRRVPCLRQILHGTDAPGESEDRTRGFDISVIHDGPPKISVWDFAGQREYYALHDYLFPNRKNSCFIYVCSCRCPPSKTNRIGAKKSKDRMTEDFQFWMRFIASNSKVTPRTSDDGHGMHLPYVHFVLTNTDTLPLHKSKDSEEWARSVLDDLREEFGSIKLGRDISIVNAHSAGDVDSLQNIMNLELKEILESPSEYEVCKEVRSALDVWSKEKPSNPLMSVREFQEICEKGMPNSNVKLGNREFQKAILAYLNDAGDIIYPKGFDFIVVNPRWFGIGVLGQLIEVVRGTTPSKWNGVLGRPKPIRKVYHENGFVSTSNVRALVGNSLKSLEMQDVISEDILIELMLKLEMWFKEDPENPNSHLFFPALFDDDTASASKGERKLNWSMDRGTVYIGRRLQCMDTVKTFLTPGLFPRLQVNMVNYLRKGLGVDKTRIEVDRNLIKFEQNEKQIFVEYSGDIDYFIDILVKSSKSHEETLKFIENHLVKKIRDFCASPQGCQGVLLDEAVIRPSCVKDLHVCAARRGQFVLVSTLNKKIQLERGHRHDWPGKGADYALDLLEGPGSYSPASSSSTASGSGCGADQHKASKGDDFPEYYLSIKDIGFQGNLNAWKGLTPFKLHLYCDGDEGSKRCEVKGQPGRDIALDNAEHGLDFSLLKPVVKFLWGKFDPGISIDTWVDKAFDRNSIPATTTRKLEELINSGETEVPVKEDALVKELEDHIARTPGRLKKILNVDDADNIWKDFRLSRAEYSTPAGKIRWLCDSHYSSARKENKLKTNTRRVS